MRVLVLLVGVWVAGCGATQLYAMPVTPLEGRLMRPALVSAAQSQGLTAWDGYDGVMCRLEDETLLTWHESGHQFGLTITLPPDAPTTRFAEAKRRADELWMTAVQLRQTMAPPGVTYVLPVPDRRSARRHRSSHECTTSFDCGPSQFCRDRGDGLDVCMGDGRQGAFCRTSVDCGFGYWCRETRGPLRVCAR